LRIKNPGLTVVLSAVILAAAGVFFRDFNYTIAGFFISGILLLDYHYLLFNLKRAASAAEISRSLDKKFVRRGEVVEISADVAVPGDYPFDIVAEDIIPAGTEMFTGSNACFVKGSGSLRYNITCLAHGSISPAGMRLILDGYFFSAGILIPESGHDDITVFPSLKFSDAKSRLFGEKEVDRIRPIKGSGVRDYREYTYTDDIRSIDWKVSAKQGKLFIREYTGIEGEGDMFIVDLPDVEESGRDIEPLKGVVGSVLSSGDYRDKILVRISGCNLVGIRRIRSGAVPVKNILNEIGPSVRDVHMYRYRTGSVRGDVTERYSEVKSAFSGYERAYSFEEEVFALFEKNNPGGIKIMTGGCGDMSHIGVIAKAASKRGIKTHCCIPKSAGFEENLKILRQFKFDILEAL
jgi:hypothetical protein